MELKFVGTSSGKASLKRYHSSFLINTGSYNLLVDAGDGISYALMNQKILFNFIDGILISHLHPDHYTGLPALIVQMKMNERKNPLYIFCDESNSEFIKEFIYQSYLFDDRLDFKVNVQSFKQDKNFEVTDGLSFIARQNSHLEGNIRSDQFKRLGFSSSSFLINVKEKTIFFTGDISEQKDLYIFREIPFNTMISEITHITTEELIEAIRNLNLQKIFITHLSEEDEKKVSKLTYQLPIAERSKVIIAFDGLNIKL
ncbi:MAG TPA: MBL fold metallo-hydrolase [Ignavibacteriaceae bacterium]|nr:MBL fold metallo-hydrolase [Ignavibacteriaceae bacterium]